MPSRTGCSYEINMLHYRQWESPHTHSHHVRYRRKKAVETYKDTAEANNILRSGVLGPCLSEIQPSEICFLVAWHPEVNCHLLSLWHGHQQLLVGDGSVCLLPSFSVHIATTTTCRGGQKMALNIRPYPLPCLRQALSLLTTTNSWVTGPQISRKSSDSHLLTGVLGL